MLLDFWIDKGAAVGLQLSESALLIGAHEPAVSCDIGREDRCEPSFRTLFGQCGSPKYTEGILLYRLSATRAMAQDRTPIGSRKKHELGYLPGGGTSGHFRLALNCRAQFRILGQLRE
jgi:hypothetical protein